MKFFTTSEIFRSVIFAVLSGTLFGCIYKSSESLIFSLKKTLFLLIDSFDLSSNFTISKFKEIKSKRRSLKMSVLAKNIFEGIMFSLFGIATLLVLYICLDGIFRLYIIFITIIFFLLSQKTIAQYFSRIIEIIFNKVYSLLLFLLSLILIPFSKIIKVLKQMIKRIILPIKLKLKRERSLYLVKKKIKEIDLIFLY